MIDTALTLIQSTMTYTINSSSLAQQLGQLLLARKQMVTAAESCTGGEVAQTITAIAGSSAWFERGFVTYSNAAKMEMLGVKQATLDKYGAVSQQTVGEMARGALQFSHADWSLAITGIAGPSGGTTEKPVGLVWFGWAGKNNIHTAQRIFIGDRISIRNQATEFALQEMIGFIKN